MDSVVWSWRSGGSEGVTNEKTLVADGSYRSFDRRIGWLIWSLLMVVCKRVVSIGLENKKAKMLMPVPLGTALHQLNSVPPTGREMAVGGAWVDI